MQISNKSHIFTAEQSVKALCNTLFERTPLNYFHYAHAYQDGHTISLNTNSAWAHHFYEKKYYTRCVPSFFDGKHYTAANKHYYEEVHVSRSEFNLDHKFEIVKRYDDYIEIIGFATKPGADQVINFYLNHCDVLEQFALEFKDKARHLIKTAVNDPNPIYLTDLPALPNKKNQTSPSLQRLRITNTDAVLYRREIQCLGALLNGYSAKSTAEHLALSPKTVEYYLQQCKQKLACKRKQDLVSKVHSLNLTHLVLNTFENTQ